ncbi:MAG TPA: alpha-hydroxy acid oxidase, partial [Micromonospora sp.]
RRARDMRNGFVIGGDVRAVNLDPELMASAHRQHAGSSSIARHSELTFDPSLTWADLAWLREVSGLPVVVKGVLTAEDARLAVAHGVGAVVVSNHGGRQLDRAVPTLAALPEVVAAVDGAVPVLVDGGVRDGTDVFAALALGADAVLLGRPVVWSLAVDGAAGVAGLFGLLHDELAHTMRLAGRPSLADVDRSAVAMEPDGTPISPAPPGRVGTVERRR